MHDDPIAVARASYQALLDKDRAALEALLADEFRFTSPRDDRIDRDDYLARSWPQWEALAGFDFIHFAREGARVLVNYVARSESGARFRNAEVVLVRDGRIIEVEAYFPIAAPDAGPRRARAPRRRTPPLRPGAQRAHARRGG